MTAWNPNAKNGAKRPTCWMVDGMSLAVMGLALLFVTGCPSGPTVKPNAEVEQVSKNVQDLGNKINELNGTLTNVQNTVNQFMTTIDQKTATAANNAASAVADKVNGDLNSFKTGIKDQIGTVEGNVKNFIKESSTTNTNNPWMLWGIMAIAIVVPLGGLILVIYLQMKNKTTQGLYDKLKAQVIAALASNNNDLTPEKWDELKDKINL